MPMIDEEFAEKTASAKTLYDAMLARYPDWLNRGPLWSSATAQSTDMMGKPLPISLCEIVISQSHLRRVCRAARCRGASFCKTA
jgi:hypothetical protein